MPSNVDAPIFTTTNAGSLLTTATWVDNFERLGDGVSFVAEDCDNGALLELCAEPVEKEIPVPSGIHTFPTFADYYGTRCSTMGGDREEAASRARRGLEVRRSKKVEAALWDGLANEDTALASDAADDVNAGSATGIVPGIRDMVQALNTVLGGARGLIHVPQSLVPYLTFYGLIFRNGNILQVANTDHAIVAGTGYTGTDPDGYEPPAGEVWIYGTGPVNVYTSSIDVIEGVDMSVNTLEVRAEFAFAAVFNPCAHIGLPVCIPDPGPDCGAS